MINVDDFIELGNISGFFGVKGWVKIYSYTRPRDGIKQYQQFYCGDSKKPISFTQIKTSGKSLIGHIDGVNTRDTAQSYLGQSLAVKASDLPKLTNEYYWHELIGLTVTNQQGQQLGTITEMMETGANDVMVIKNTAGEETLIPYAMSLFVLSVDVDKGEMQVNWELDEVSDAD